jgi:hypothetical protein
VNRRIRIIKGMNAMRRLWLSTACVLSVWSAAPAAEEVLISHPSVAVGEMTLNTTRLMFSMQLRQWPDGMPVRVFVMPDNSAVHRGFAKDRLSLYPRQLRRVWDRQLYSGTGQVPETVDSEQQMRDRIASTPGSVGYISSEMIDDTVKVLEIR